MLDKNSIKVVTEAKFLGVVFDRTLSHKCHVDRLNRHCPKALNNFKVVGHTERRADRKISLCLYRALLRPKLDYGCLVYGVASKLIQQTLDPIHHQGLRTGHGAFRTSPVSSLYVKAQEMTLRNRLNNNNNNKLSMNYVSAYNCVFEPPNSKLLKKSKLTPPCIQGPASMWLTTSQCQTLLPGVRLNPKSVFDKIF